MCLEVVQCVKAFDKHLCSESLNLTSDQNLVVRGGAGIKSEVEKRQRLLNTPLMEVSLHPSEAKSMSSNSHSNFLLFPFGAGSKGVTGVLV